jgi:hypothetical protein
MHIRIALAFALLLAAGAARADGFVGRVHRGPFAHVDIGGAYLQSRAGAADGYDSVKLTGGGLDFAVAGGWSFANTFSLGAELYEVVIIEPDVEYGGDTQTAEDSSMTLVGFGPRLQLWIAPDHLNMYVAATFPCVTRLTSENDGSYGRTELGLGGRLSVGKEWWVSHTRLGLGLAGHLDFARNKDSEGSDAVWNTFGAGLTFSATWN